MKHAFRVVFFALAAVCALAASSSAMMSATCARGCNRVSCRDAGIQRLCRAQCPAHEIRNCLVVQADAHGNPETKKKPCELLCAEAKCKADASLAETCRHACSSLPDIDKRCPAPADK